MRFDFRFGRIDFFLMKDEIGGTSPVSSLTSLLSVSKLLQREQLCRRNLILAIVRAHHIGSLVSLLVLEQFAMIIGECAAPAEGEWLSL